VKPLCIDLFCGLGGWAEGFLLEGWRVIGFDIERHRYHVPEHVPEDGDGHKHMKPLEGRGWTAGIAKCMGMEGPERNPPTQLLEYPGELVLQDVLTIDGRQFRNADCIVASPPCQFFSYCAMPWSRAKELAAAVRGDPARLEKELALFKACFRIQRQASESRGRNIPLVVENVKGAQPWVGRARAAFGSYFLWGDIDSVNSRIVAGPIRFGGFCLARTRGTGGKRNPDGTSHPQGSWFGQADSKNRGWKQHASGPEWFDTGISKTSSRTNARKAASAIIAKIPLELSRYIAQAYKPHPPNHCD